MKTKNNLVNMLDDRFEKHIKRVEKEIGDKFGWREKKVAYLFYYLGSIDTTNYIIKRMKK